MAKGRKPYQFDGKFKPSQAVRVVGQGVYYNDNFDAAMYCIDSLCRLALTDVGKFICNGIRMELDKSYKGISGAGKRRVWNAWQYWVRKQEGDLIVGHKNLTKFPAKKSNYPEPKYHLEPRNQDAWYAVGTETGKQGTVNIPIRSTLVDYVTSHVDDIRKITAAYLSGINQDTETIVNECNEMNAKFKETEDES